MNIKNKSGSKLILVGVFLISLLTIFTFSFISDVYHNDVEIVIDDNFSINHNLDITKCSISEDLEYSLLKKQFPWLTHFYYDLAKKNGTEIDPELILSIIHNESRGISNIFGRKVQTYGNTYRAVGLMQVMPFNYDNNIKALLNPKINVAVGTEIFVQYLNLADGNIKTALAFYNAGPNSKHYPKSYIEKVYNDYQTAIITKLRNMRCHTD